MNLSASDITPEELRLFGDLVARLEELGPVVDVRTFVLPAITQLRADFAASFDCDEHTGLWRNGFAYNVDPLQIARYEAWFQHIDPVTPPLRARRVATCVDEVVSRRELEQTEFYTDFLCRDGMHHGINVYAFDGATHVGDLRIWRAQGRPDFTERDKLLLNGIEPFFRRALLRRRHACTGLTGRERRRAAGCRRLYRQGRCAHARHRGADGAHAPAARDGEEGRRQPREPGGLAGVTAGCTAVGRGSSIVMMGVKIGAPYLVTIPVTRNDDDAHAGNPDAHRSPARDPAP